MGQGEKHAIQVRAKKTRDKLVMAFTSLLREKPLDDIAVAEIAKRAGVSVGTVYRRFDSRDAFLPLVLEAYQARLIEFATSREGRFELNPDAGMLYALKEMTRLGWQFLTDNVHLVRAAYITARTRPDLVGGLWDDVLAQSARGYRQVLDLFADEIIHEDRDEAAAMVLYLMNVGLAEYALYPEEGQGAALSIEPERFTSSLARSIYGYLTIRD
jgi:AcrR family transcriptional regulator